MNPDSRPIARIRQAALPSTFDSIIDAYGRRTVLAANGTTVLTGSTIGNQRSFTGLYEDAETGLLYARARYMSPTLGRFVGRDPLDYVDGMSLYSSYFVPNALDPSGTDCISSAYAEFKKIKCCPSDLACWAKEMARITTFYNSCLTRERLRAAPGPRQNVPPVPPIPAPGPGGGIAGGGGGGAGGGGGGGGGGGAAGGGAQSCMMLFGHEVCSSNGLDLEALRNTDIDALRRQAEGIASGIILTPVILAGGGVALAGYDSAGIWTATNAPRVAQAAGQLLNETYVSAYATAGRLATSDAVALAYGATAVVLGASGAGPGLGTGNRGLPSPFPAGAANWQTAGQAAQRLNQVIEAINTQAQSP